jgi:hypothetical protein
MQSQSQTANESGKQTPAQHVNERIKKKIFKNAAEDKILKPSQ